MGGASHSTPSRYPTMPWVAGNWPDSSDRRAAMQDGHVVYARVNRTPCPAMRSRVGVNRTGCPAMPRQSPRCWSVMMSRIFGREVPASGVARPADGLAAVCAANICRRDDRPPTAMPHEVMKARRPIAVILNISMNGSVDQLARSGSPTPARRRAYRACSREYRAATLVFSMRPAPSESPDKRRRDATTAVRRHSGR